MNSNRQEELRARRDGATLVKNSGRGLRKGDAKRGNLLIDYKFTDKNSFALNDKSFGKHYLDAAREGYEGVVVAVFDSGHTIAMVNWQYLMDLEDKVKELLEIEFMYEGLCK